VVDVVQHHSRSRVDPPGRVRRPGWILVVLSLSQLMIVLDATIVNIALPAAQHSLGFGNDQRQWVVIAYALAFGSLLILGGRLGDVFGRTTAYIIGLGGFAVSSAIAGASVNFGMLVAGRAAQGAFGALLAPAALSLLATTFTESKERSRAFGIFGAVSGAGGAVGLLLGGVPTQYANWRWTLFVNLFFAAFAIVGALIFFDRARAPRDKTKIDIAGTVLVVIGLVGIVYGFSSAETHGWIDPVTIVSLAGGVALVVEFVVVERRTAHPLLPMRVLLDRTRGGSYLTIALIGVALFTVFLFLAYYLQTLRGYTPVQSGVAFLPLPFAVLATSTALAPRLMHRFGPKPLIVAGTLVGAAAMVLMSTITLTSSYWLTVAPALLILGIGMGTVFASTFNAATAGIDARDAGVGAAMVNTAQQVGGAIGTAVLSSIAQGTVNRYLHQHGHDATAQAHAQLASYTAAFLVGAGILAATAIIMAFLLPRHAANHGEITTDDPDHGRTAAA
jgi:EmrB/QacA subfamily drug resistance transporter